VIRALLVALALVAAPAAAQTPPPEVEQLRALLASPAVQAWLAEAPPGRAEGAAAAPEGAAPEPDFLQRGLARAAQRRDHLMETLPRAPAEIAAGVAALGREAATHGWLLTLVMVAALVGSGLLVEWRFLRATRTFRKAVLGSAEDTVPERLAKLGLRVVLAAGAVTSFALASLGVLFLLPLPPLTFGVAARVLFFVIAFRVLLYACRILIAPGAPERRVVPMPEAVAEFWMRRIVIFGAVLATGFALAQSLMVLGVSRPVHLIVAYAFFAALVVLTVIWIWQRRHRDLGTPQPSLFASIFWSVYVVALFAAWMIGGRFIVALPLVAGLLPLSIGVVNRAVHHILREAPPAEGAAAEGPPSVLAAAIERGARLVLIVGSVAFLLEAWNISLEEIVAAEGRHGVIARAVLYLAALGVIYDFVWHLIRTAIDSWIARAEGPADDPEEARHRARLRTLLPILRNLLQGTFAIIGVMMAFAAIGVNIAPLIAGAGVVGVAIGFGAQNTVKDIIAGMFYLLDDAFRVGEYIVAGGAKGTVESFSIRSVKLRHHRGAVYTIPFGSLGAIQNLSRDWVIEKLAFTLPFGTDMARVKKIVKTVSAELWADPALAPAFLEPVKLQGVDAIEERGLVVKVKFMARPGEQFSIRRRTYVAIEKALMEAGIHLAYPTVRVVSDDEPGEVAAAAVRSLAPPAAAG
jgi:small-conductance mechanosensitive channel